MPVAPISAFPRRIFLDTCTVQALSDCGNYIFGEDALEDTGSAQMARRADGAELLHCLRMIFAFDERACFDWIVSAGSIAESDRRSDKYQACYIRDISAHSNVCIEENPPEKTARATSNLIDGKFFNFLSAGDRLLIKEALLLGCDTFLTVENRLLKNCMAVRNRVPLVIANPITLWRELEPHVAGL